MQNTTPSGDDGPLEPIGREVAAHVLHHFGASGGRCPATFTDALIHAIATADLSNRARLQRGFPEYVAAVVMAKTESDGIARLQQIAAGE